MSGIGFDCGTYNLVSCHRDDKNNFVYKREVNAFLEIPLDNRFVFNMMKSSGVPLIERDKVAYALGEAACNMAYTMSALELKRPMIHVCVNPKEKDAFQIMSIMIHSLIDGVKKDGELLYYCVPANAINQETDADYHQRILEAIFKAFKAETGYKVDAHPINEALALVYAELGKKAFTGIGVSCLCPGTKIYTNKGIVEIQNVKEGDHVITHTGKWSEISKVVKKEFRGTMTKLQISGYSNNTEEYKFVDNHELLVKRDGRWTWIGCEEIVVGDIVGEPILKQNRDAARPAINICERTTCSKEYKKRRIESTPDLQRFMGYFLGDGSINESEGCIQIDFGSNESEYAEDVIQILNTIFDKDVPFTFSEKYPNGSVIRVKCYSRGLLNWMSGHCYDQNGEKQYPWSLDRLTNSECSNLLCGLVRANGTISEDQITFGNTNTKLVLLAKQLFSRIGMPTSISWREPREHFYERENRVIKGKKREWSVSCAGKKVSTSLAEQFTEMNCQNSQIKESIFIEDGFCCGRVQAVEHEEYEGDVYDLQVPGDHSFSGPFLTIHNCGAGMVNICYAMYGNPVFAFSIVNSGDWIDRQAAKATGETISFINKEKTKIDLTKPPASLVERAIHTQYRLMIEHTVAGIKKGFSDITKTVRTDAPVDVVIAGGTSSPYGFANIFKETISQVDLPIKIGEIIKPNDPLYSVARGCLIAAEAASK